MSISVPPLPKDIYLKIVGNLVEGRSGSNLFSCALVSREFREISQYWIFHTIQIQAKRRSGYGYFKQFFSRNKHLGLYVRGIDIWGRTRGPLCACTLSTLLPLFPHLESIIIGDIHLGCRSSCRSIDIGEFTPIKIRSLEFWGIPPIDDDTNGMKILFRFFSLFSEIGSVNLDLIKIENREYNELPELANTVIKELPPNRCPRPQHITLQADDEITTACIMFILTLSNTTSNLESLTIFFKPFYYVEPTVELLRRSRTTLRTLFLDVSCLIESYAIWPDCDEDTDTYVIPARWQFLELSLCASVTHFKTAVAFPRLSSVNFPVARCDVLAFFFMLDLIYEGPKNIETLTIYMKILGKSLVETISRDYDWEGLKTMAYDQLKFPNLQSVNVVILTLHEIDKDEREECISIVTRAVHSEHDSKCVFQVSCERGTERYFGYWPSADWSSI